MPAKRSLSHEPQLLTPLQLKPALEPKTLNKTLQLQKTQSLQKEPPKPKLTNVNLEMPQYSFPFSEQSNTRLHVKNDLALGMSELRGRNVKIVQYDEEQSGEVKLLNAVLSKKMKNEEHVYIEIVDQKPQKYHHLKKNLKNIEELKHREFLLCQEPAIIETKTQFLRQTVNDGSSGMKYWPIVVLNNASKTFKTNTLTASDQQQKVFDDFSCVDEDNDIASAVRQLEKEGTTPQLIRRKNVVGLSKKDSDNEPIIVEDDLSEEVSSIFKMSKKGDNDELSSISFTASKSSPSSRHLHSYLDSKTDFDLFSDLQDSPNSAKKSSGQAAQHSEVIPQPGTLPAAEDKSAAILSPEKLRESMQLEKPSSEHEYAETQFFKPIKLPAIVEEGDEQQEDDKEKSQQEDPVPSEVNNTVENVMNDEQGKDHIDNAVLIWYVGTNTFET